MASSSEPTKQATGNGQQATRNEEIRPGLRIGANIAQRLLQFASRVLQLARSAPKDPIARHVSLQVARSATSAGANYEEARAAESRADFIHKLGVAAKEIRETLYWLQLIANAKLVASDLTPLVREAMELSSILVASIRTARRSDP